MSQVRQGTDLYQWSPALPDIRLLQGAVSVHSGVPSGCSLGHPVRSSHQGSLFFPRTLCGMVCLSLRIWLPCPCLWLHDFLSCGLSWVGSGFFTLAYKVMYICFLGWNGAHRGRECGLPTFVSPTSSTRAAVGPEHMPHLAICPLSASCFPSERAPGTSRCPWKSRN